MNLLTSRKKQYQAILFDLDGTLTDPKEGITKSIQYALGKINVPAPNIDELEWCIGPSLKDSFSKLTNSSCESLLNLAVKYYRERYSAEGMYENKLYSGVEWMLSQLWRNGYRLFVATSKPELFAIQILEHFGLTQYFEKIHGAELDGTRSNKSDLIKYIITKNLITTPSLMVGDREFDINGALQNNIGSLGVTYGYGSAKELRDAGAHDLCGSPTEVYHWIHS